MVEITGAQARQSYGELATAALKVFSDIKNGDVADYGSVKKADAVLSELIGAADKTALLTGRFPEGKGILFKEVAEKDRAFLPKERSGNIDANKAYDMALIGAYSNESRSNYEKFENTVKGKAQGNPGYLANEIETGLTEIAKLSKKNGVGSSKPDYSNLKDFPINAKNAFEIPKEEKRIAGEIEIIEKTIQGFAKGYRNQGKDQSLQQRDEVGGKIPLAPLGASVPAMSQGRAV